MNSTKRLKKLMKRVSVILLLSLTACGGGTGDGLDKNGFELSDKKLPPLEPTLSSIQANVFSVSCALPGCHIPGVAPNGLSLDSVATSAKLIINVDAFEAPGIKRVAPFDPDNSYIIHKVEGTAPPKMPLGNDRPPLTPEVIAVIRQWISNGAKIN